MVENVFVTNPLKPHLAGYFALGEQPRLTIGYLVRRFKPTTVLDVGSGPMGSKKIFHDFGIKLVWCIDGDDQLLYREDLREHLNTFSIVDLERSPYRFPTTFDMVFSYECAEHIKNVDNYVETVTINCGKILAMTHALPGQGGYHHVNEQDDAYWIDKITKKGFKYLESRSKKCRAAGDGYFSISGLIFERIK